MFKKDNEGSVPVAGQSVRTGKIKIASGQDTGKKTARSTAAGSRSHPSIIAGDVRIKGSIHSEGDIQIDGTVEGDIRANKAVIGREGVVGGELLARNVVVHGKLKGIIQAATVHLCSGSDVDGDIVQTSLTVDPEARFSGQIRRPDDTSGTSSVVVNERTKLSSRQSSTG